MKHLLVIALIINVLSAYGQFNPMKKFDYSLLENKTLWVPQFDINDKTLKKLIKKDKIREYEALARSTTELNNLWHRVMSQSSYDATDYIMKKYSFKEFWKEKPEDGIALVFMARETQNRVNYFAELYVAKPKARLIAQALINDLDITDEYDLRLIINMLNQSLNTAMEMEEDGDKSIKAYRNKYKNNFVNFFNNIDNKTFLAPQYNDKKMDNELKEALKSWNISSVEVVHENEINQKREESANCCFYWKNIPFRAGFLTYNVNMIISTENDEVLFTFVGKKRLKASNIDEAQSKMLKRAEKYKRQLGM